MITFLRLTGLATAAVWLGGTVLFIFALDPLFSGSHLLRLLGPLHAGETGLLAFERFQLFQVVCASFALIHVLAQWLYSGRPIDRRVLILLVVLLGLASGARLGIAPRCRVLNAQAFLGPNRQILRQAQTPAQRQAERSLAIWQGIAVVLNILSLAGVTVYFLQEASPQNGGPRLFPRAKLRI